MRKDGRRGGHGRPSPSDLEDCCVVATARRSARAHVSGFRRAAGLNRFQPWPLSRAPEGGGSAGAQARRARRTVQFRNAYPVISLFRSCYLPVSGFLLFRRFYSRFNNLAVPARDNPLVTGKPAPTEASLQLVGDLFDPGFGAGLVLVAAGRAGYAHGTDHILADLDRQGALIGDDVGQMHLPGGRVVLDPLDEFA